MIHALFFLKNQDCFSIWEGNISDYVAEEPTAKNTMQLKHFLQELPVNDKIETGFFVVSEINCSVVNKITDFTVILSLFLHWNHFYYWLLDKILNHFWMDISSTEMLLGSFMNVQGHIYWGKIRLIWVFLLQSFFSNFFDEQRKNIFHVPVRANSTSWQIWKLPSIYYLLHILWYLFCASLLRMK